MSATDRSPAHRLAGIAAVIAAITVLARLAGFARTAAYGKQVGSGCVGSVYTTANTIPNIVFDVVAGGMLSALVVPILAPALARGDRVLASRLASALLSWAVVVLVPIAVVMALAAGPLISLLGPGHCPGAHSLGVRMLVVFAPQIVFYALGVVLGGVLTAAERFVWPALAPLLSSLVVVSVYLIYGAMVGAGRDAAGLPRDAEVVLSVGTTAGVVVLAGCLIVPAARAGLRYRPTLRFPVGLGSTVRAAALAGASTLAAQEISTAVMIRLANDASTGTLVSVATAQTVFLLPWAVLSLPIATTTYPGLAAAWSGGRRAEFQRRSGLALGVVIVAAALGSALLVAVAQPTAALVLDRRGRDLGVFAPTVAAFALGLLGWSLVALLARVLYAAGEVRAAAAAQVTGQLVVIAADVELSSMTSLEHRAVILGLGNSIGVSVSAVLLVAAGRRAGVLGELSAGLRRLVSAVVAGGAAAALGWLVGRWLVGHWLVGRSTAGDGAVLSAATVVLASAVTCAAFIAVLGVVDRAMLRSLRDLVPGLRG